MNKEQIDKNVKAVFKAHPDATKVYVTSDGFIFLTENAARLHQNTNKSGKKLGFAKVSKSVGKTKPSSNEDKPKTLSQMNKEELKAVAKEKGVDISIAKNKKDIAKLIRDFVPQAPGTPQNRSDSDQGNENGGVNTETTE